MKFAPVLVSIILLSGCARSQPFVGPNGKTAYSIRCGSSSRALENCYQQASAACPGGYNVVERSSGYEAGTTSSQRLVIECKDR